MGRLYPFLLQVVGTVLYLCPSTSAASVFFAPGTELPLNDYTMRVVSRGLEPFEPFNVTITFANPPGASDNTCTAAKCYLNACEKVTADEGALQGKGVLFTAELCDLTDAIRNIYEAGASVGFHLYGADRVQEPFDIRTRFVFNPAGIFKNDSRLFPLQRIHGYDPARVLLQATGCRDEDAEDFVTIPDSSKNGDKVSFPSSPFDCTISDNSSIATTAKVVYSSDPWQDLYNSPLWVSYVTFGLLVAIWLVQHTVRSLRLIHEKAKAAPIQSGSALSLQQIVLGVVLAIGIGRFVEGLCTIARAYGHLFVSDLFQQLIFQYLLLLGVVMMAQLILFWMEVLRNASRKLVNISRRTQIIVLCACVYGVLQVTVLVTLYSLKITENYLAFYTFHWLILGIIAVFEAFGMLIFGTRILNKLKKGAAVRNKGNEKSLAPMTRLVIVSAMCLLLGAMITLTAIFYPPTLRSPKLFPIPQILILLAETLTYFLTIKAVSPLAKGEVSQRRRRNMTKTNEAGPGTRDTSEPVSVPSGLRKLSLGIEKLKKLATRRSIAEGDKGDIVVDQPSMFDSEPGMRRMTIPSL